MTVDKSTAEAYVSKFLKNSKTQDTDTVIYDILKEIINEFALEAKTKKITDEYEIEMIHKKYESLWYEVSSMVNEMFRTLIIDPSLFSVVSISILKKNAETSMYASASPEIFFLRGGKCKM